MILAVVYINMNAAVIGKFIKMTHTPTPLSLPAYCHLTYATIHTRVPTVKPTTKGGAYERC